MRANKEAKISRIKHHTTTTWLDENNQQYNLQIHMLTSGNGKHNARLEYTTQIYKIKHELDGRNCYCAWVCLNVRACASWERVVTWCESTTSHELLALLLRLWLLSVADACVLARSRRSNESTAPRAVEPLHGTARIAVTPPARCTDSFTGATLKQ